MKQRTHDDFDSYAKTYRDLHNQNLKITGVQSSDFAQLKVRLVNDFEKNDSLSMLDFGCGDGLTATLFSEQFPYWEIVGLDTSEKSIEWAQKKSTSAIRFLHYDGQVIPFESNHFDLVFISCVLHHIDFRFHSDLLLEIKRVLKPGGRLYIFEHNPLNPLTRYLVNTCEFDADAVLLKSGYTRQLLRKNGFEKNARRFILFFPPFKWFKWVQPIEKMLGWLPLGGQYFFRAEK